MNVLFICTTGQKSTTLKEYYTKKYPQYSFRSGGIMTYQCRLWKVHRLEQEDIDWANLIVYVKREYEKVVHRRWDVPKKVILNSKIVTDQIAINFTADADRIGKGYLRVVTKLLQKALSIST